MGTVTASQSQGHDIIIGFRPIPPALEKVMRTVDRPSETDSPDVGEYTQRAAGVIAEIRTALDDHEGFEGSLSALAVAEARNAVTNARGLLLLRRLRSGQYSHPLGEIFSKSGRVDDEGIEQFDRFRYGAYTFGLKLWIHQHASGDRLVHRAFAVVSESPSSTTFMFLARLLVTPAELEQWRPIREADLGS